MKRALLLAASLLAVIGLVALLLAPLRVRPDAIAASVERTGPRIEAAWALPAAARFKSSFRWQSNPSLCGPTSLANVLRSLGEPPVTDGEVLAGTGRCWSGYCLFGLTLDELAEVARARTGRTVTVLRDLTLDQFRAHLHAANDPVRRFVVNFHRERIFGAGAGHHSPIGGYLEAEDLVFVLDVNRDFGPWLVSSERLFSAIDTLDGDRKRGLLLIE